MNRFTNYFWIQKLLNSKTKITRKRIVHLLLLANLNFAITYPGWEIEHEAKNIYWMRYFESDSYYADWAYRIQQQENSYEISRTGALFGPPEITSLSSEILYDIFKATKVAQLQKTKK